MKEGLPAAVFEHLHLNVANKEATAEWYVENVGLEIIPTENSEVVYVADQDRNFMFEFSSVPGLRTNYADIESDGFHYALEGREAIEWVAGEMLKNGATQEGEACWNPVGDYVVNLSDPNGLNAQLIHPMNPFYQKAEKSVLRFKHFAFNTPNQMRSALWYVEFMSLTIPWSKDIEEIDHVQSYRVPYVGDVEKRMSFE